MNLELWELVVSMLAIVVTISGLIGYFFKRYLEKSESNNNASNETLRKETKGFKDDTYSLMETLRADLKDFRKHFDTSVTQVYASIDMKNKELRDFVSKELEFIRNHITAIESKIDSTRERSHEIEKDLLRLQSSIGKDYITKEDLENYMLRNK